MAQKELTVTTCGKKKEKKQKKAQRRTNFSTVGKLVSELAV